MDRFGKEHSVDPACARACKNIRQDTQLEVSLVLDMREQAAIHRFNSAAFIAAAVKLTTCAGELPDLFRDAVHVDCEAHSAITDQCDSEFLLPHSLVMAGIT